MEVKAGRQPFATTAGQAHAYSVYTDRCYLADWRPGGKPFTADEIEIATQLGIGLLAIGRTRIVEVSAAPKQTPIERLPARTSVEDRLRQLCRVRQRLQSWQSQKYGYSVVTEQHPRSNRSGRKPRKRFCLLARRAAERKKAVGEDIIFHRRYVCADCVANLFGDFVEPAL